MLLKVTMVTSVPSVLCDSVCVWALYFRDSAYRRHVLELRKRYTLLIPEACLIEVAYPIYRAKGLSELRSYASFLRRLPLGRNIRVLPLTLEALARALELITGYPDRFVDEEGNPNIYDAILAAIWEKMRVPLATSDSRLIEYGEARRLEFVPLRKARN
jgi:predicted nucleic acid-binding protein